MLCTVLLIPDVMNIINRVSALKRSAILMKNRKTAYIKLYLMFYKEGLILLFLEIGILIFGPN